MKCVVQRVASAEVRVDGEVTGRIGRGLLVLAAFAAGDGEAELAWMARKLVNLRLFNDAQGRINLSLAEVGGGILLVPQFTLYGDCRKGNRPSFIGSAPPEVAAELYARFGGILRACWPDVAEGRFGARMEVSLVNTGPVTLIVDRDAEPVPS
ncbi:D-tyrosyl-tRNA(Tyr) deacylase [bacterium]|nr:D-tyrosyl-tRNA(Tyr) deacylase [bacterium]MBU1675318.1 D-tyrosyl-tRNA(Tyr) deacylase [bacterium]